MASQQSQQVILNPHLNHLPQQIPQQPSLHSHHILPPPPHILDHTQNQVNNYPFNPQNGHFMNATGNIGGNGSLNMFNSNANGSNNNLHHLQQQQQGYHHYTNDSNGLTGTSSTYSSNGSLSNINGVSSVNNNQLFSNQHQLDINNMGSNEYYIQQQQQQQQQQSNGHLNHMNLNHGLVGHHMQPPPPPPHQQYGQQQTLSNPSHMMTNNMYHQLGSQQQTHHHMHMQQQQQHLQSQTAGQTHSNYLQMNHLNHAPPQMWTGNII